MELDYLGNVGEGLRHESIMAMAGWIPGPGRTVGCVISQRRSTLHLYCQAPWRWPSFKTGAGSFAILDLLAPKHIPWLSLVFPSMVMVRRQEDTAYLLEMPVVF